MKNSKDLLLLVAVLMFTGTFAGIQAHTSTVGGAYLVFAKKMGGEITPKQIGDQCELQVEGCAKGSKIFTYTLAITKKGKTTYYKADSNELTSEMIAQLKSLSTGDEFEFKKIKAYLPNGKDKVDVYARKFIVV